MGILCPICGTHQGFVRNLTADGKPATHTDDVVARELACGHVIGGPEYRAYVDTVHRIDVDAAEKILAIKSKARDQKITAWRKLNPSTEGE